MGIDIFEEINRFKVFQKRINELEQKGNQLETNLEELSLSLEPFSVKKQTIQVGEDMHILISRKMIRFELPYRYIIINKLEFFDMLKRIDSEYIKQLGYAVRKQLQDYFYQYLLEGIKLKIETITETDVPVKPIKIFTYSEETKTIYVGHLKVVNLHLYLEESSSNLSEAPFKWTYNQTLNALAIAQQYPEIFDFYIKGLENYDKALDYNFSILKNMEQIISPFVIAKRMGRKIGDGQ